MGITQADICDVSVLGLGAMGGIVAAKFVESEKRVAIWNRSAGKAEHLVGQGARRCATIADAVRASPVVILVMLDTLIAHDLLADAREHLSGRTIINFSSATKEANEALRQLVEDAGAHYIKSSILSYPRNVGHSDTYYVYSGDQAAFEAQRPLLDLLGGHAQFMAWDQAGNFAAVFIAHAFGSMLAFYEAVAAGGKMGLPIPWLARALSDGSRFFVADAIEDATRRVETGDFSGEQATIDVHAAGVEPIAGLIAAAGFEAPSFDAFREALRDAQAKGFGDQDIASLINAFLAHGGRRDPEK